MATRTPRSPGRKPGETGTEFQLHKSQDVATNLKMVFDYTEYRLLRYIDVVSDEQQKMTLRSVLKDYKSGLAAVAWRSGKPVWLPVTKESYHP